MKVGILPILGILVLSLVGIGIPETIDVSANVLPYLSVTFSYDAIDFGSVSVNTNDNNVQTYRLAGNEYNYIPGALNVTIITNKEYKYTILKNAFTPSDLTLKFTTVPCDEPLPLPITYEPITFSILYSGVQKEFIGIFTEPGDYFDYHYYKLDVGLVRPGVYTATVTITYSNVA